MKSFIVNKDQDGKHVVRAATLAYPMLTAGQLQKALKHKDIRVDGKKVSSDVEVAFGQEVEIWLPDSAFEEVPKKAPHKVNASDADYKVVAETDDLLIVNKRQGIAVHDGKGVGDTNLIDEVRKDTGNKEMDLCHRIDMNTGGLVMMAKNKSALEDAIALFKDDLLIKRYRCLVLGVPTEGESVICEDEAIMKEVSAYLEKANNGVFIHDVMQSGDLPITSRYRVLNVYEGAGPDGMDVAELEVELVTGRMHQIRAQFAHMGYPIIGDGNYGRNKVNTYFKSLSGGKVRYQQLFATSLILRKIPKGNKHSNMSGRVFSIIPRYDVVIAGKDAPIVAKKPTRNGGASGKTSRKQPGASRDGAKGSSRGGSRGGRGTRGGNK
ncbi:MAG: RluA family pseudouridine synthase [Clostridia bacterium]|nr:RluA family pseudouridine synthase [Clostridia bacterium]